MGPAAAAPDALGSWCARSHQVVSPYDSPYQAFINLMNVIVDLKHKVFARLRR